MLIFLISLKAQKFLDHLLAMLGFQILEDIMLKWTEYNQHLVDIQLDSGTTKTSLTTANSSLKKPSPITKLTVSYFHLPFFNNFCIVNSQISFDEFLLLNQKAFVYEATYNPQMVHQLGFHKL